MKCINYNFPVSEDTQKSKVCESCGAEFLCGAETKTCWCFEIELTDQNREKLNSEFKNCLCKSCLEKFNSAEV